MALRASCSTEASQHAAAPARALWHAASDAAGSWRPAAELEVQVSTVRPTAGGPLARTSHHGARLAIVEGACMQRSAKHGRWVVATSLTAARSPPKPDAGAGDASVSVLR